MKKIFIIGFTLAILFFLLLPSIFAKEKEEHKVTICHATSSETNPYVRIVVDEHAISGHFDNNGTPLAGHEDDILLQGEQDCPGGQVTPTDIITPTTETTPTIAPTGEFTNTPTPTLVQGITPTSTPSATVTPTPTTTQEKKNEESHPTQSYTNTSGLPLQPPSKSGK